MKKQKGVMPQSTAGLIRYFEESDEQIKLRPEYVIGIAIFVIILEILLKFML